MRGHDQAAPAAECSASRAATASAPASVQRPERLGQQQQRERLAGAVVADERDQLARAHREVDRSRHPHAAGFVGVLAASPTVASRSSMSAMWRERSGLE